MAKWKIPLYKILVDKDDVKAVTKVIRRGMDWAIGPEIEQFEKSIANYVGTKFAVSFNSGTSALHAALLATGIHVGHEVIVPSFTFVATSNPVLMVGARPKFVDIEEETLGLDPEKIESAITKRTQMIMPAHYSGLSCKIEEISQIAKQNGILLMEDAAASLGSMVNRRMAGTWGDLSMFSFAGNKVLTTGEGGVIVTNSRKIFEKLKLIRSHGRIDKQNYFSSIAKPEYVEMGYNWRMSSITAALGLAQLHKIEKLISLRRKNANYLSKRLSKFCRVPMEPRGYRHIYQLYSIRLENMAIRNNLMKFLARRGIMSKVFYNPVHLTVFYKKLGFAKNNKLNTTETVSREILSIPLYPGLNKEELDYICESIKEFFEKIQ